MNEIALTLRHWLRMAAYHTSIGTWLWSARRQTLGTQAHETSDYWNKEHVENMFDLPHNGVVSIAVRDALTISLLHQHRASAPRRVLDLGCSTATLLGAIGPVSLHRYVGVDLSGCALDKARQRLTDKQTSSCEIDLHESDLRAFEPDNGERFDLIAFNEVLKYLSVDEAVHEVIRAGAWLADHDSIICVAMTIDAKNQRIYRELCRSLTWVYGMVYQQCPHQPHFRLRQSRKTPGFIVGLFRPSTA